MHLADFNRPRPAAQVPLQRVAVLAIVLGLVGRQYPQWINDSLRGERALLLGRQ
jgi:hypothetical protein